MRCVVLFALLLVAVTARPEDEGKYTDRYDDVNPNELIANRRLLLPYIKCVLDKGRCTPEGKELKVHVQDAMQTGCSKCTDKQKEGARKVVSHIRDNEKEYWEQLQAKFDPKEEYKTIYESFLDGKDPQPAETKPEEKKDSDTESQE